MEPASASPTALLVDDDAAVRRAMVMLMTSIGWQSTEASSAKEALILLTERTYNLAIIDINMPGMNGIELCRSIHLGDQSVSPVCIVLSGLVDANIRKEALLAGAKAVMIKPIGRQELIDQIKNLGLPCL